jgi:hypothetical protein
MPTTMSTVTILQLRAFIGTCFFLQAAFMACFQGPNFDAIRTGDYDATSIHLRRRHNGRDYVKGDKLRISNIPTSLPWKVSNRYGPPATVVPVDYAYFYNPSILELADGSFIYAGRMSWLYGGDCHKYAHFDDPEPIYNCLRTHAQRFADQSVIGQYRPVVGELEIVSPSSNNEVFHLPEFSPENSSMSPWNGGSEWFDTRLLYPYNHRYSTDGGNKIIMTSQNTELIRNAEWSEVKDTSTLVLQLTYIGTLDPSPIFGKKNGAVDFMSQKKLSRWFFFDANAEREEFDKRRKGIAWTPMVFDVARLKCKARPAHLPALPFQIDGNHEPSQSTRAENHSTTQPKSIGGHIGPELVHEPPAGDHRRLAALEGDAWVTIKDKNWAPFAYKSESCGVTASNLI